MKIAIISIVFPFPVDNGGSAGTFNIIEQLRKTNEITFFCPNVSKEKKGGLQALWPNVKILTTPQNKPDSFFLKLFKTAVDLKQKISGRRPDYFYPKTHLAINNLSRCYYPGFVELIQNELASNPSDLIQVEFAEFASLIHVLPSNVPRVFVHHELRYKRLEMEFETLTDKNPRDLLHIKATKDLEIALLNQYDKVITLSDQDANNLEEAGVNKSKLAVSPLPISLKKNDINKPFQFQNKVVFLGPEAHYPNLDAVNWFLETAWPKIAQKHPNVKFQVISKWSEEFKKLHQNRPNIEFLGFVKDLSGVLNGAIMLVPLRIVSGMRMKILEGISWRVPIVSTSDGAEGLPMEDKVNCMIADTPEAFVEKINLLIESESLANALIEKSQELTLNQYNLVNCGKLRNTIYTSLKEDRSINAPC